MPDKKNPEVFQITAGDRGTTSGTIFLWRASIGADADTIACFWDELHIEWRNRRGWTRRLENLTEDGQSEQVPMIVKLAGSDRGAVYERPLSNLVCGDLALEILSGEISTPASVVGWLDRNFSGRF